MPATLSPSDLVILAALLLELALLLAAQRLSDRYYRFRGCAAFLLGAPALLWLVVSAAAFLWDAHWKLAVGEVLKTYVLATATWLAWKSAKPY